MAPLSRFFGSAAPVPASARALRTKFALDFEAFIEARAPPTKAGDEPQVWVRESLELDEQRVRLVGAADLVGLDDFLNALDQSGDVVFSVPFKRPVELPRDRLPSEPLGTRTSLVLFMDVGYERHAGRFAFVTGFPCNSSKGCLGLSGLAVQAELRATPQTLALAMAAQADKPSQPFFVGVTSYAATRELTKTSTPVAFVMECQRYAGVICMVRLFVRTPLAHVIESTVVLS